MDYEGHVIGALGVVQDIVYTLEASPLDPLTYVLVKNDNYFKVP